MSYSLRSSLLAVISIGLFASTSVSSDKNPLRTRNARFENCAKIASAVGASCAELSVEIDVIQCGDPAKVVRARVKCEGDDATLLYRSRKFDYRATMQPNRRWWGKIEWRLLGDIARTRIATAQPATPVKGSPPAESVDTTAQYGSLPVLGRETSLESLEDAADEKDDRVRGFLRDLVIKGSIDLYYSQNFNRPTPLTAVPTAAASSPQNTYRVFDIYHDSAQLSLARLLIQKQAEPVGGTLDIAYGPAMQTVSGAATDGSQVNLKQAILSFKTRSGVLIEAGRFVTHIGYEVIESNENWNYSRGLLFGYFDPFWHQGVRASYAVNDQFALQALLVNGWNNSYDFNGNKNFGVQLTWTATEDVSVVANFLSGQEPATPVSPGGERKSIYDLIATYRHSDVLSFAVNLDSLNYAAPTGAQAARGGALYARYTFLEEWALSPRLEHVIDSDNLALGATFPGGQEVTSMTMTLEYRLSENLLWRGEVRSDRSTQEPFTKDGKQSASQETATAALIGSF